MSWFKRTIWVHVMSDFFAISIDLCSSWLRNVTPRAWSHIWMGYNKVMWKKMWLLVFGFVFFGVFRRNMGISNVYVCVICWCSSWSTTSNTDGDGRQHRDDRHQHHCGADTVHWQKHLPTIVRRSHRSVTSCGSYTRNFVTVIIHLFMARLIRHWQLPLQKYGFMS